ncbi:MAG: hypothetical protein AB8B73_06035 [Ekhidna sp.]
MKLRQIAIVLSILASTALLGQKVKYKDIFPSLDAKKWDEVGMHLPAFLIDKKAGPNAHLQMGFMLHDNLLELDAVSNANRVSSLGDSTIMFYSKAKELITEKELKNDKYYLAFNRRDLRTGKFGIKLSDVHLEIEKKIKEVQSRLDNTKAIDEKLASVSKNYKSAATTYKSFSDQFLEYSSFLIGADDKAKEELANMITSAETAEEEAKEIIELADELGSKAFSDEVILKQITDFGKDGVVVSAIGEGAIEMWDYADWGFEAQSEIRGSIGLYKSLILNYAFEIREKKNKVKKGTDVEIEMLNDELIGQFQKYDPESTVEKLLRIETLEAQIIKQVDFSINQALQDSSLIGAQLEIFEKAKVKADEMNVLVSSIIQDDLEETKKLYREYSDSFFSKYGTSSKYVSDMKIWSGRQVKWLGDAISFWEEKNRWGQSGENLIPLYIQDSPETNFFTLGMPVKEIEEVIVWGVNMEEKKGYLTGFGPDRFEKWNNEFELPESEVVQFVSDTVASGLSNTIFYVFNEAASEKNLTLVNYSTTGELIWNVVTTVPKLPVDFKFDNDTEELTVFLYGVDEQPADSDELGYIVVDRTGEIR